MVAAKTPQAGRGRGGGPTSRGNAVDAAVATAFAAAVAEPWMNGIGGGGYLVVAGPGVAPAVVAFPMVAPRGATADMFPLSGGAADAGLFGWPGVVGDANLHGPRSVAIPGVVAGLALAVERFGTRPLADAIAPAVRLAAEGCPSPGTRP
jgi:gamma-glutamyltranspeptidase/glutathione hydrolase